MPYIESLRQTAVETWRKCTTWVNHVTYEQEATSFVRTLIRKYCSGRLSSCLPDTLITELEATAFHPGAIRTRYDYHTAKMAWDSRPRRGDIPITDEPVPDYIHNLRSQIPPIPEDITGADIDRIFEATRIARASMVLDERETIRRYRSP